MHSLILVWFLSPFQLPNNQCGAYNIREVNEKDVSECVKVIRDSFATVADEFGFNVANAPGFTAFATTGR